jgi:hypothetical protein
MTPQRPLPAARELRVWLVAAEASGDRLGAALMRALRKRCASIAFAGVGGPEMAAEGVRSLFSMTDSIIGLAPILPAMFSILRRIRLIADAVVAENPDVLVIIDSAAGWPDAYGRGPRGSRFLTMCRPRSGPRGRAGPAG